MIKNLQRAGLMLICFLLVFGTALGQKAMAAGPPQQPGDERSVIPNEPITGAAFGKGVYIAVGYYGKILKSSNGFDWQVTADKTKLDDTYTGVAFGNNQFVAVGEQGTVMTSPDGEAWTQRDSTISTRISRVAYVGTNGINKFYATSTAGKVITSADGITWSTMNIGMNNDLTSIAVSDTAIVIGSTGGYVHTSTDGTNWATHTKLQDAFFINSVLSLNKRFYANDALGWSYTSGDGYSWSKLLAPFKTSASSTPNQIFGGLYDNSKYYLFGYDGTANGGIFTSTDGINFQQQAKGSTMTVQNAFFANGVYMQLGNDGMVVSNNGTVWQYPYGGSFTNVIYAGNRYLAVGKNGNDGFIKWSTDFINWSKVNLNLVPALNAIVYGNSKYVAVGDTGTVVTSSDGTNWSINSTAISEYKLTSVTYGNGVFVAVDEIGTIYLSTTNGASWTSVREDTDNYYSLQSVSYMNGKFYAVGDNSTYLESTDNGASWHTVASSAVPTAASFNINANFQADIPVTPSNALKSISVSNRGTALIQGIDFTESAGVVTLKKEMLSQLVEGWQTFTFHSGNGASQILAVNVNNTSPVLNQATNLQLSKTGVATWDGVPGAAGYEVQLYRNGSVWGSAVSVIASAPNVDFLAAMRSAGAGKYTFKVKAKGNTVSYKDGQQSGPSNIREIFKAPTEDGTANKAGTAQNANFNIKVNALNGAAVTAKVGAGNVLQSVTSVTTASGKATLPIDITKLTEGSNDVVIAYTDVNDNFSEELMVSLTKDTIAPLAPTEDGTANKGGTTQNSNFNIVVNAETDAKVTAKIGGTNVLQVGTEVKAANGKATLPIDLSLLAEGLNSINVVVTDALGAASGTLTVSVTKDTSSPATPIEDGSADKNNTTQTANFNIIVDTEAGAVVTAKAGGVSVLQSGNSVPADSGKAVLPIDLSKLAMGNNDIVITAVDTIGNSSGSLTVKVTRALSSNADLSALGVSGGALNEIFAAATTSYTMSVANNVENVTVTPTSSDAAASMSVNGSAVLSGQASTAIPLNVGANRIEVVVTAADHSTKTYTIVVTRISNNALLTSLSVDQGTLTPDFSTSQLHYQVDVPNMVSSLNVFFVKGEPNETITVTGATYSSVTGDVYAYSASNLSIGSNVIGILVTAQDGTTNNAYSLTIDRAPILSGNADLSQLTLSSGTLTPAFTSGQTSYTSDVANEISSLTVTGNTADNQATMTINGTPVTNGQASGNVNLSVGPNVITLIVTAQNGTSKTYTIYVNRTAPVKDHEDKGLSGSVSSSNDNKVIGTDGRLTLSVGQFGEVSFGDEVTIFIPAGAASKELKISIEKVVNTQNLIKNNEVLVSPIFEILKNISENFSKPVTLSVAFNPALLQKDQKPSIFYFDEVKKAWVEVAGGKVAGNRITVEVNHFTKFAVMAVGQSDPTKEPSGSLTFSDTAGHWAEAGIKRAVSGGIVSGYPDGTFKPNATVTRAEFAVMLMNALKLQGEGAALTFTDTAKIGTWAQKAVAQAVKAGIIHGYEDGSFRPDAQITRAEMAVIVANAMGAATTGTATGFSDDERIPAWAKGSVAFVKQAGIVQGRDKNEFAPQDNATRAEAVIVLLKVAELKSK
ncbi:S-layer homology domain-containing protein [Paenibacillus aceris]|uniref:Photosystem II stability/assembly factor-like uncharacterized protein n=1 Tax=Paenibacillus aceris TaxID=869555 RepID=A0ABS4HV29_9BACL|nr:S-layer homology domain-containing protein [Paenibacillus aceris]MBP1962491.1 photosystem II stability/assembly factor-like uncharacterized protein [Paenibacillus aceris]NHW37305.1 hypothetical protein [Paenibacillus aceris]